MPISVADLLAALKEARVANYLRSIGLASASSESLGRYPGVGAAQNDNFVYNDNVDNNSPAFVDYVLPRNFQRIVSAKLSIKIRPYRTYNTLSISATGIESNGHTHTSTAHTHTSDPHAHHNTPSVGGNAAFALSNPAGLEVASGPVAGWNTDSTTPGPTGSTTPGATGGESLTHTHNVSASGVLGVTEGATPVNPGITVSFDGTDHTTDLGGPWNADQVEIDVTRFLATSVAAWHTVALLPNQITRIVALLRISYYVDSRLAQ